MMKFKLYTSDTSYIGQSEDHINMLKSLGFKFDDKGWITDFTPELEVASLDELLSFVSKVETDIIISRDTEWSIEIYDDYRE